MKTVGTVLTVLAVLVACCRAQSGTLPIEIQCNLTTNAEATVYSYSCEVVVTEGALDTLVCTIDESPPLEPCLLVSSVDVFDYQPGEHTATITATNTLGNSDEASFFFVTPEPTGYLPFIMLNVSIDPEVVTFALPRNDDGVSESIFSEIPIPFGNSIQHYAFVTSHGVISFGSPFYVPTPFPFPSEFSVISNSYLVAPFWSDIDIRIEGDIIYEVHTRGDSALSDIYLDQVGAFIDNRTDHVGFQGTWMVVAQWDAVHPWPHGISSDMDLFNYYQGLFYYFYGIFIEFDELQLTNTFQGIVITDGESTYAVFTYQCGFMEWSTGGAVVGYNAAGDAFENHPSSGSLSIHNEVSCRNDAATGDFRNLVYRISFDDITMTDPPPTIEPPQTTYLEFLPSTDDAQTRANRTVPPCDDCSLPVFIPPRFPFGSYYHDTAYIGTNGIISFGEEYSHFNAEPFPTEVAGSHFSYVVAPFWADADARLEGAIYYETHESGGGDIADLRLENVSSFIRTELGGDFIGRWMLLATWDAVHPFPHGSGSTADPYLMSTNTFQTVLITDGAGKSYAVYIYRCGDMDWSDEGTIGFNAAGEFFENHDLTGLPQANAIACVHLTNDGSVWNNVIYDLVPDPDSLNETATTPAPPSSIGSCAAAGYTSCCIDGDCTGAPVEDCFCDDLCRFFGDCCTDINVTCSRDLPTGNDTYLLFANHFFIRRVDPDGSDLVTVVDDLSGGAFGIDYHHELGLMFWSDFVTEEIYQANLDGSGMTEFINTSLEIVDDVAVDWINDKLYWTDTVHARIEVADLADSSMRKVLLQTGGNTLPRAIVVDPRNRFMYWSDWGETAMIERASMDGQAREIIVPNNLIWPFGITIDYAEDRLYWADANLDKIEYSNLDGSNRLLLETELNGVLHPFSLTIENELLYWTEWQNVSIFATHKTNGQDILVITPGSLFVTPNGIEAITPNKQPQVDNPCDGHGCSHFCLLSSESLLGYTCACPNGGFVNEDLVTCNFTGVTPEPPEGAPGSCVDAGYDSCCTTGFCAGTPPSCLCDFNCHFRGDCCDDIDSICPDNTAGSCAAAGFTDCCPPGDSCSGSPATCFCDVSCLIFLDCCDDFSDICIVPTLTPEPPTADYIPFLMLDVTDGVDTVNLPAVYAGSSNPISIPSGFPFGNAVHDEAYVNSIGVISFEFSFADVFPSDFPGFASDTIEGFLVAPYWSDNDISGMEGEVFYEVHVAGGTVNSDLYLANVSDFISRNEEVSFQGTWMLVAQWEVNHPWPYGAVGGPYEYFYQYLFDLYGDVFETNTYQALVITDGTESYAVYTYQCDFVQWSRGATIGYNAGGDFFANHALSATVDDAAGIDCSNVPITNWTNVIYRLSVDSPTTEPPPPTIEPPQTVYLEFLERTTTFRLNGTLDSCDDCSSPEINISTMPFPLGRYQHSSFFVATNGIISFGREFSHHNPAVFPTLEAETFYTYVAAAYWGDADTRTSGEVYYEVHVAGDNPTSDELIDRVNDFLAQEEGVDFDGNWMLVVHWDDIPPFGFGNGFQTNTYQGILISNGVKSYAVYIYMCGLMQWSDDGTIGWNAAGEQFDNHPLSGLPEANDIACVHQNQADGSVWNNVVFDLVPEDLLVGEPTPPPLDTLASCVAAGYDECCRDGDCTGVPPRDDLPQDCFCDEFCFSFFDCCHDISQTCGRDEIPFGNDTYLIFTNNFFIRRINPDGTGLLTIIDGLSGGALGIEYHSSRGVMFWTDTFEDRIYQANLDGTDMRVLLDESLEVVEDLATDWVNNKLYFTDALHARIEVIDLDQPDQRVELLRTGGDTLPRSIVVDPRSRHMYWTDWGLVPRIEQASMDGAARTVVIDTDLDQPWGITIDYDDNKLYWVDASLAKIEYSNFDGTSRITLETDTDGVLNPFGITIENNLLYWTETGNVSIFTTHKVIGKNILALTNGLSLAPGGIEAVTPGRQPQGIENLCDGNQCSDVCLLSSDTRQGYSCACPRGGEVMEDGITCNFTNATPEPSVTPGSCVNAGFDDCCVSGFCAGTPPNCLCDFLCTFFGDCCSDFSLICTDAPTPPTPPTEAPPGDFLAFLELGVTDGVQTDSLGAVDDDSQGPIPVSGPGFPFGNSIQTTAYVGSNGVISFGAPYFLNFPSAFPGFFSDQSTAYVVAPFWDDVDARMDGDIFYEVHEAGLTDTSDLYLTEVSGFISSTSSVDFQGTWMLVAQWDAVHPYPHGAVGGPFEYFYQDLIDYYGDVFDSNTFQGIVITDGNNSFAVFTYRCDLLGWSRGAVIGYNAAGDFFENHDFSGGSAESIDCINLPVSNYSNVVYQLSIVDITITDPPPTIEPAQTVYLDFLEPAPEAAVNFNKTLPPCDDCSSPAYDISARPFPLGEYLHTSFYVGNNGIVSMGREFPHHDAAPFPTELADTFYTYAAAPFWGDADTRKAGEVYYEVHERGLPTSDELLDRVSIFIQTEEGVMFVGSWMLVVSWNAVHPWPHGKPGSTNPVLEETNTYQAVLITDGSKSYAVYIYQCGLMGWSDEATIGWNAGGELYANHPLSGLPAANEIACVHQTQGSDLNNVIYDLVPGDLFPGQVTPPPLNSTGSCVRAGYTQCCDGDDCSGSRDDCSCNQLCYTLSSCCHDIAITCPSQAPGIVQNIAITAPSVDVLTITWDPPADVFFTVAGYQVTLGTVSVELYNELVTGNTTTQVPNLAGLTPYYITIVTVTVSVGNSDEATAVGFTEEGTPTIAPTDLAIDRTSGTTMVVSWVPLTLEEAQGFVAGYDISYQPSSGVKRQALSVRAPGNSSEITIDGLDPVVSYSASVAAATTVGSGDSSPPVTSPGTCPFQIHFFGADRCSNLNSDSALDDIIRVIIERTNQLCQCGLLEDQITNRDLSCNRDRNAITFRAAMLDNDNAACDVIVNSVKEWVTAADTTLTVQGTELTTNIECPVNIGSLDENYCDVVTSSAVKAARVAAPVVVVVVVIGSIVVVVAVVILLHLRRRKKTTYEVFGEESEVGSVNLTETAAQYKPAGASFNKNEKEKEGIVAFGVGEDSGKVKGTEYQQMGWSDFQNPMYGIPAQQQPQQQEQQQTEPEYAKVDLAAKKQAEADEEAEIEKMKLEMESATYEVPGPVENPYANDPVAMLKAQEAGYEEPK